MTSEHQQPKEIGWNRADGNDSEFLDWCADRFHFEYHESENLGWMQRLRKIARSRPHHASDNTEQCITCRHDGTRACAFHGYPKSEISKSCKYKLGVNAEESMRNLTGTFIDCWTKDHDAAIERKAREDVLKELQDYYSNLPEHEASCPFDKMNSDECQGMEGYCETCILNHAIEFLRGERK